MRGRSCNRSGVHRALSARALKLGLAAVAGSAATVSSVRADIVFINAFAITDTHICALGGAQLGLYQLPAMPVSAAGIATCGHDEVGFELCVETVLPSIDTVTGGVHATFPIPFPIVAPSLSWTNGQASGVVVFTNLRAYVITGGTTTAFPLPGPYAGYAANANGVVVNSVGGGATNIPLAACVTVVPFGNIVGPGAHAIAFNLAPCKLLVEAQNAGWPLPGVGGTVAQGAFSIPGGPFLLCPGPGAAGNCAGAGDCANSFVPYSGGQAHTETIPNFFGFNQLCYAMPGRSPGAVSTVAEGLAAVTAFTNAPSMHVLDQTGWTTYPLPGAQMLAAGADCKVEGGHCRALLIGNDGYGADADNLRDMLLKWHSWDSSRITVLKNVDGAQILSAIQAWAGTVGQNDTALVYYSGYSGIRNDADNDESLALNAPFENDIVGREVDEVIGKIGAPPGVFSGAVASDDDLKTALGALPAATPLLAIFDTCYADGQYGGAADLGTRPNTIIFASTGERSACVGGWTSSLLRGLCDGGAPCGVANADANADNAVLGSEWAAWVAGIEPATRVHANPAGFDLVVCRGAEKPLPFVPPPGPPGAGPKGEDGSGACSRDDYGDLPDGGMVCINVVARARNYATTLANNGPRYNEWTLQRLGAGCNGESQPPGPVPNCAANTDQFDDGVVFVPGGVLVTVTVNSRLPVNLRLDGWLDVGDKGVFLPGPPDHFIDGAVAGNLAAEPPGANVHFFPTPAGVPAANALYSRFRLTWDAGGPVTSAGVFPSVFDNAMHGEVEDYAPIQAAGVCGVITTTCYSNCDCSIVPPALNVADFTCFLQRFANGDPYANCDGTTTQPSLNVADFTCFLQKYAIGCP